MPNSQCVKNEVWKDIPGYEDKYQVSNLGRIKSCTRTRKCKNGSIAIVRERILKPRTDKDGYKEVALSLNGANTYFRVHRLVATAFIPNPLSLPLVNHKDENPANNIVDNLEWCDYIYNRNYSIYKVSQKVVCNGEIFPSIRELCRALNCETKGVRTRLKKGGLFRGKYEITYYNPPQNNT